MVAGSHRAIQEPWHVAMLYLEWDARKERSNVERHGVDFTEASTVFGDPMESTVPDPEVARQPRQLQPKVFESTPRVSIDS